MRPFKQDVVEMIADGRAVPEIVRSLGIGENILYRWREKAVGGAQTPTGVAQSSIKQRIELC